jgi:hypothetical protein
MPESDVMRNNQLSSKGLGSPLQLAKDDSEALRPMSFSEESLSGISSASDVVVLCWDAPAEPDRRAQKIAAFMGATVRFFSLTPSVLEESTSNRTRVPRCSCLIVQAQTLAKIAERMSAGVSELRGFLESAEHVLVYGFQPNEAHDMVLRALSSDRLVSTRSLSGADAQLHVAMDDPEWCFQFSGLCVGSADPAREKSFVEGDAGGALATLIRIGDQPFFVRGKSGGSQLFFLAGGEWADLDENVTRYCSGLKWFCGLVPLMMFLRGALKDRVWHNDHPRACFIIDDPLLKSRHGFLEYERLVESLRRHKFSACIAFIPWNYRRSSREIVKLFSSNPESAFLCVHGCDHTKAEFETADVELLRGKAVLALDRMRKHRQLSGIPFDDIMVFPQGLFSKEAIPALKAAGYLAAANTELGPSTMSESLSIRDLLDVAVTRFADFPLFGRHYPNDLAEFAFDLFMGKPALATEHHGYFKGGYEALENFIMRLKALDGRLEWTNLDIICSHACLTKVSRNGDVFVRFYTQRFRLKNTGQQGRRYILQHCRGSGHTLPQVAVDGIQWSCEQEESGILRICLSLEPGQTANIEILPEGSHPVGLPWKPTKAHNLGVWLRRVLCEVRDNYVETSRILNAIVSGLRKVISRRRVSQTTATASGIGTSRRWSLRASALLER